MTLGEHIMLLRKQKGLSRVAFGKAFGVFGNFIGRCERNENSPSIEKARKIAKAFDVPADYRLGEGACARYDAKTVKPIVAIEDLDSNIKFIVFNLIDIESIGSKCLCPKIKTDL